MGSCEVESWIPRRHQDVGDASIEIAIKERFKQRRELVHEKEVQSTKLKGVGYLKSV